MSKKSISARLPEELVNRIDKICENRTNFLAKAVLRYIDDPELFDEAIQREKDNRDELIKKKQRIEREIEQKRDEVRDLEHLKSRAKTMQKVKEQIPSKEIHKVRQTVRANKYDNDPRSADPEQVVQHNAKRLAENYDIEKTKVVEVLRVHTEV